MIFNSILFDKSLQSLLAIIITQRDGIECMVGEVCLNDLRKLSLT